MNKVALILQNRKQVLGRNERQLSYIRKYNLSRAKHIADNKVLSKRILHKNNIPVPKKVTVIRDKKQLDTFNFDLLPNSFVVKPVNGTRGGGIEIFYNRDKNGNWIRADRSRMSLNDLKSHCRDILDGKYSLFNEPDIILFEERVKFHKNFKYYTYKGAPDIRVIVYNSIPIMSYVRLPTKASEGKANLDLGAIGVGIDLAVGKTTSAIIGKSTPIEYTPDTHLPLSGIRIPYWDKILAYAIEASKVTGLGYGAMDFLIDRDLGPVIVEMNARPGLSIQIANHDGLRWRLKKAQGLKVKNTQHGIRLSKNLFGGEIEEELEELTGKQVIGLEENINLYNKDDVTKTAIKAKIDTGASITSIDTQLARELGYGEAIDYAEEILKDVPKLFSNGKEAREYSASHDLSLRLENSPDIYSGAIIKAGNGVSYRPSIRIKFEISGQVIESHATLTNRTYLNYPMIIGQRDLKKFLIDPSKK